MQFAKVNGVTIHYTRRKAAGKPALALINSLGTDFRIWHGVIERLEGQFDILAYDNRGHGLSTLGETPYTVSDHAGDLIGLMDHEGMKNAILCGVSIGGQIALRANEQRPDLVSGMILCDTGYKIGNDDLWNQRIETVRDKGLSAISAGVVERWFRPEFRAEVAFAGFHAMVDRQPDEGYASTCIALRDEDLTDVARKVDKPTLGLVGEYDALTPPALMEEFCTLIPGARYEIIKDAGHIPSVEQPEAVARHIAAFAGKI